MSMFQNDYTPIFNTNPSYFKLCKLLQKCFMFIIVIGLIGNAINVFVYTKKTMRLHLSFRLLLLMSILDFIILSLCGTELISDFFFEIKLRTSSIILCKTNTFLTYFLTQIRNVLSLAIIVQRALILLNLNRTHVRNDSLFQSSSAIKSTVSMIKSSNTLEVLHFNGKMSPSYNSIMKIITTKTNSNGPEQQEKTIELNTLTLEAKYQKKTSSNFLQVETSMIRRNSTGSFKFNDMPRNGLISNLAQSLLVLDANINTNIKNSKLESMPVSPQKQMSTKVGIVRRQTIFQDYNISVGILNAP